MSNRAASSTFSLPNLLEQVFQRYSTDFRSEDLVELFVELDSLLGSRVVRSALQLLDHQSIVVYHNPLRTREIAEINEGHASTAKLIRLFPNINYCTCEYFQSQVLTATKTNDSPYTCEHVLALRLALLVKSDKLRYEELPSNKINLMLPHFIPGDDSTDI